MNDGGPLYVEFMAEIGGGQATKAQFIDFVNRKSAIENHLDVPGSTATALYAGQIGEQNAFRIANDLADRSSGKLRILDNTDIGKFMLYVLDQERDFPELNFDPTEDSDFIKNQFKVVSERFVASTDGPIITITPNSADNSVYAEAEIKAILDNPSITTVNGRDLSELRAEMSGWSDEKRRLYAKAVFDGDFAEILSKQDAPNIRISNDANGAIRVSLNINADSMSRFNIDDIELDSRSGAVAVNSQTLRKDLISAQSTLRYLAKNADIDIANISDEDFRTAIDLNKSQSKLRLLSEALERFRNGADGNPSTPDSVLNRLEGKLGKAQLVIFGLLGLGLFQIARESDMTADEAIDYIRENIDIPDDMAQQIATGAGQLLFQQAALTLLTGGVGTIVSLALLADEVRESAELFKLAVEVYGIAFPDSALTGLLNDAAGITGKGEDFASKNIKAFSVLEDVFKADFEQFDKASSVQIADGSEATDEGELRARGTNMATDGKGGIDIIWGRNGAVVEGLSGNDLIYMQGYGSAYGGEGRDYLIADDAVFIKAGTIIDATARAAEAAAQAAYEAAYEAWVDGGQVGSPPDEPEPDTTSARFEDDQRLLLDGGAGNDFLFVGDKGNGTALLGSGGTGAIVVGGAGNDTLFNYSYKGQMWGGGLDGRGASDNERDVFIVSPGSFIMDAGKNDRAYFLDKPLLGGTNAFWWGRSLEKGVARDWFLNFVTYGQTESGQLLIDVVGDRNLTSDMSEAEILKSAQIVENWDQGDLGIQFFMYGGLDEMSLFKSLYRFIGTWATRAKEWAKDRHWAPEDDPLVLDLNGDGLVSKGLGATYFDQDGDGFAERTGWIDGNDGFLVHDADGSGTIDDVSEMFGSPGVSGFAELLGWDTNGDGVVNATDAGFASLKVWRDRDGDGVTDAGELYSLAELGITALSATPGPNGPVTTANGTIIRAESVFTRSDGSTGALGELIFETDRVQSRYTGDRGVAAWAPSYDAFPSQAGVQARSVNAKGYGRLTDLAVAASQDLRLADTLAGVQAAMAATAGDSDAPSLYELQKMVRPILGVWSAGQTQSRELAAVLVSSDGATRLDHAVYTEDATGGYWTLKSGAVVRDAGGATIARPSLEQVLAQATTGGATWQRAQIWSPSDRGFVPAHRAESVYLTRVVGGVAVIDDHAVRHVDANGSYWTLASGRAITDAQGATIARATLVDIKALSVAAGQSWRSEDFAGAAPAPAPYPKIAFQIRDGILADYSVWVGDGSGGGYAVWLKDFLAAQGNEARYGAGSSGLAAKAIDFAALGAATYANPDDYRIELIGSDQLDFAFDLYGIQFRPELFVASRLPTGPQAGMLDYAFGDAATRKTLDGLVRNYVDVSKGLAVRIAAQGPLARYFEGVQYDAASDSFKATSGRELIPLFTRIFEDAPVGSGDALAYLKAWDDVLQVVYPDFKRNGKGPKSQAFLMHMVVAAYENAPLSADFIAVADALSIKSNRVVLADGSQSVANGSGGDDLFYISGPNTKTVRGGQGADTYVVGRNFGNTVIQDVEGILERTSSDHLRFAHLTADQVYAWHDGADLMIREIGTNNVLTIKDHFQGRRPGIFGGDFSENTEMVEIVFADGKVWDYVDIAFAVSHPLDSNDVVVGTEALDVLAGGKGNDILRGGGDSDLYIFNRGDGQDRIVEGEYNPFREQMDIVRFGEGISADHLRFKRVGASNDLTMLLTDDAGNLTGDSLVIDNQFSEKEAFLWTLKPHLVERLTFADGSFLDDAEIRRRVLAQGRTDGADALFGFGDSDRIDGGAGNDLLAGLNGADTYIFAKGYGHDVIEDQSLEIPFVKPESQNTLILKDIRADEIEILRDGGSQSITLKVLGSDDMVTLSNQFNVTYLFFLVWKDNVDFIRFADGTQWDMDRLSREALLAERTDGDDHMIGFDWSDVLDGGAGNDRLEGGLFNDSYIFERGSGHDVIFDSAGSRDHLLLPAGYDELVLKGIAFADVDFKRAGNDLTLVVRDTGETIRLQGQYDRLENTRIERFVFADVTMPNTDLNPEDINLVGTSGDDILRGTHYRETIDGRAGNDTLYGSSDSDTYLFDIGYGIDTIIDRIDDGRWRAGDNVRFGADITSSMARYTKEGNDLIISFVDRTDQLRIVNQFLGASYGIENFYFFNDDYLHISDVEELLLISGGTFGDDNLIGFDDRENILDGRQGDDTLVGGRYSDTYLFGVNYGFDQITEVLETQEVAGASDRIVFGALVDKDNVIVRRDGANLLITIAASGDQLKIVGGLEQRLIETYDFADGTIWSHDDVLAALLRGTENDDELIGFNISDDLLDGGKGNDDLRGLNGNDVYRFGIGYGLDSITDTSGTDCIELGENILPQMLRFAADGNNLVIRIEGFDDALVVMNGLSTAAADSRVEKILLADGYEFSLEAIRDALILQQATGSDDIVTGFASRNDIINGNGGNDELVGLSGNDTYVIGDRDGMDIVDDRSSSSADILVFEALRSDEAQIRRLSPESNSVVIGYAGSNGEVLIRNALVDGSGIESLQFSDGVSWNITDLRTKILESQSSDGNDLVSGFAGADKLAGGAGDDVLEGGSGADEYSFSRQDGYDVIADTSTSGADVDVLKLFGYALEDISFSRLHPTSNDIVVSFVGSTDEILLRSQYGTSAGQGIERIEFSDGRTITRSQIVAAIDAQVVVNPLAYTDGEDSIVGTTAANTIEGGAGNDTLYGYSNNDTSDGADILVGGTGNDWMRGAKGNDIYRFSRGFGVDTINEGNVDAGETLGVDTVEFDATIAVGDVIVEASGRHVILKIRGTGDQILLAHQIYDYDHRIEQVRFADGTLWDYNEILARAFSDNSGDDVFYGHYNVDVIDGGDGNDSLFGYEMNDGVSGALNTEDYADTITGGAGNDWIRGMKGNDIYRFSSGFGQDIIDEGVANTGDSLGTETIEFDASIAPDDVIVETAGTSLILKIRGTEDRITLLHTVYNLDYRVEQVRFADGTLWNNTDLMARAFANNAGDDVFFGSWGSEIVSGGDGNDTLYGYAGNGTVAGTVSTADGNDTLIGGKGNDWMRGADGSDTFLFSAGFGQDTIDEGAGANGTDTIEFDATITSTQLDVFQSGNNLILSVRGTEDRITIINTISSGEYRIEQVRFADGTTWTHADLLARVVPAAPQGLTITGTASDDALLGTAGRDTITGGNGSDTIHGDQASIYEAVGTNLIVNGSFEQSGPNPVTAAWGLQNSSLPGWQTINALTFEQVASGQGGVAASQGSYWFDLDASGANSNHRISQNIDGLTDGEELLLQFDRANRTTAASGSFEVLWNGVVVASFNATGTAMVHENIIVRAQAGSNELAFRGTGTADTFGASLDNVQLNRVTIAASTASGADTLSGGVGNDQIYGGGGNDSITGGTENDLLFGEAGDDSLAGDAGDDTLDGGSGNDIFTDSAGNDIHIGGTGDDRVTDSLGNDIYRFARGDGQDTITDAAGVDRIEFAAGIVASDIEVRQQGSTGLILKIRNSSDRLTLVNALSVAANAIEEVRFADGTVWTHNQLLGFSIVATDGNDLFYGTSVADIISGGAGDDDIFALGGNDQLYGGSGNDSLAGDIGDDILAGNSGDDTLTGAAGNDVYRFARGDGQDMITDTAGADRIEFAAGIVASDIEVRQQGSTGLILKIRNSNDRLTIVNALNTAANAIEEVRFSDGTILTHSQLLAMSIIATDRNDIFYGTGNADIISGGAGNDTINALGGDDQLFGDSGNDTLNGDAGNDLLDGGADSDTLTGAAGNDIYRFGRGYGQDTITDTAGVDRIEFVGGLTPDDIQVEQWGATGLIIRIKGTSDRLNLTNVVSTAANIIETATFADGTIWTNAELFRRATLGTEADNSFVGTANADELGGAGGNDRLTGNGGDDRLFGGSGNDQLEGSAGIDELSGGTGNDRLSGGTGGDIYRYARGDGRDVIIESGSGAGDSDGIVVSGYTIGEVRFRRFEEGNNDLALYFGDAGDSILIVGGLSVGSASTVDSFQFTDSNVTLSLTDVIARLTADLSTGGDDYIVGSSLGDVFAGSTGNDTLVGNGGNDSYYYRTGDGRMRIIDSGNDSNDRLLVSGYSLADVARFWRSPPSGNDLIVDFADGGRIILSDALDTDNIGVDRIEFDGGTIVTTDSLRAQILSALKSDADGNIWGFASNDILAGGKGSDTLSGGLGDDVYRYAKGDGFDAIEDNGGGFDRIVIEGYASTEVMASALYRDDDGIVLRFAGNDGDELVIDNLLGTDAADQIEEIEFADGVIWTRQSIIDLLGNRAPVTQSDGFESVVQGRQIRIDPARILANDFDADNDPLSIISVTATVGGTVEIAPDGKILFTAAADFTGLTSFSYTVSDGRNGFATDIVRVRVRPVASASDDSGFVLDEDGTFILRQAALLANDADGDQLRISQVLGAQNGIASLASNGDVTFTPFANFNGTASFRYIANTPEGGVTEAKVTLTVRPMNDGPTARNDDLDLVTDENQSFTFDPVRLLGNDSDIDGDRLVVSALSGDANLVVETLADGTARVSPLGDFFGTAWVNYSISDGNGGTSSARVKVTVRPVNDAPILVNDSRGAIEEDGLLFFDATELLANDFDPDGDPLTFVAASGGPHGSARLFANGTIQYTPNNNFYGATYFTYTVSDGQGGQTTARVNIDVTPVNDRPVARDDGSYKTNQDQVIVLTKAQLLGNDYDVDSPQVFFDTVSNATNGTVELREDGLIYFTPDAGYWGSASFRYVISDGDNAVDDAVVSLYFRPTGQQPAVARDDFFQGTEDQPIVITKAQLLANDYDPNDDEIRVTSVGGAGAASNGISSYYFNAAGDLVIVPVADIHHSVTLQYWITDDQVGGDSAYITVNFAQVNDAPTAGDDTGFLTSAGRPLVIRTSDIRANDYDLDNSTWVPGEGWEHRYGAPNQVISALSAASAGTIGYYDADEEFIVIETGDTFEGEVSFNYTLTDSGGLSDQASVSGSVGSAFQSVITGSNIRDLLIGTRFAETLIGLDGKDDLLGRGGDDILRGGDDADILDGGDGMDLADYEGSNVGVRADILARIGQGGHAHGDTYRNIEGIIGSQYADQLYGTLGANYLAGSGGDDHIEGNDGDDSLLGGAGADRLIGGAGADQIDGGEGIDTGDYGLSAAPVHIDLAAGTATGDDASGDVLTNVENLIGTEGDDSLGGDAAANNLSGGRGNDLLSGGAGDDLLYGGRGADVIDGGTGSDTADYFLSQTAVTVNLASGTASGGDADGDVLTNIENIRGSYHDDVLAGDAAANVIRGGSGADIIDGGDGIDTLDYGFSSEGVTVNLAAGTGVGGEAEGDSLANVENVIGSVYADTLTGTNVANHFDGGRGNDNMQGGLGSDSYVFDRGSGEDLIGEGDNAGNTDRLMLAAGITAAMLSLTRDGNDLVVELEQGPGFLIDRVRIAGHFGGAASGIEEIVFADNSVWDRSEIASRLPGGAPNEIFGTAGIDQLHGTAGADAIYALGGDDKVWGDGGSDRIYGGAGNDQIYAFDDGVADEAYGEAGDDILFGGTGGDLLDGGDGADLLYIYGDGIYRGGSGDDSFQQWDIASNSIIDGGDGVDTLNGNGRELINPTISGVEKFSSVKITAASSMDLSALSYSGWTNITANNSGVTIIGPSSSHAPASSRLFLTGGAGDDILAASVTDDDIRGEAGNDILTGGAGNDYIDGGTGTDTVTFAGDISTYRLVLGTDGFWRMTDLDHLADGNDGTDILIGLEILRFKNGESVNWADIVGTSGDDSLQGSARPEWLWGLGGNDLIHGGAGNDTLNGGAGINILYGDDGDDTLKGGDWSLNTFVGGVGADTLDGQYSSDTASYETAGAGVILSLVNGGLAGDAAGDVFLSIENATGSSFADEISGSDLSNIIAGGDGADILYGLGGDDRLHGDGGSDRIYGGTGNDQIYASDDGLADEVYGEAGDDTLFGGTGDLLDGGEGSDLLGITGSGTYRGGSGDDAFHLWDVASNSIIDGGDGVDTLNGNGCELINPTISGIEKFSSVSISNVSSMNLSAFTYSGWSTIKTNNAGVTIIGPVLSGAPETSRLTLIGGTGDDTLVTFSGEDHIAGEAGNDVLTSGAGNDYIDGGSGIDTLVLAGDSNSYSLSYDGIRYVITDLDTVADGNDGTDNFVGIEFLQFKNGATIAVPTTGPDIISGTSGDDRLFGLGGDDTLSGEAGNDVLDGGAGNDNFNGGSGNDVVQGGQGDDTYVLAGLRTNYSVSVSNGLVTIIDTASTLDGDDGTDQLQDVEFLKFKDGEIFDLRPYLGTNIVNGTAGADTLNGTFGTDHIFGFDGADYIRPGAGADIVNGGTQVDSVGYEASSSGVVLSLVSGGTGGDASGDMYVSIENVVGSNFDDVIEGDGLVNLISGNDGNDVLRGLDGNDDLSGGNGSDIIYGGAGNDNIGSDFNDNAADIIHGDAGNDLLRGGAADVMHGGAGNDQIDLFGSNVRVFADDGDDRIEVWSNNITGLEIDGGAGLDRLILTSGRDIRVSSLTGVEEILAYPSGANMCSITIDGTMFNLSELSFSGTLEILAGSSLNTTIAGPATGVYGERVHSLRIYGAGGDDNLTASTNHDRLFGGLGNDQLFGLAGNDELTGGAGDDLAFGGEEDDTFVLAGLRSDYSISAQDGVVTIIDNLISTDGNDGTDQLRAIEFLRFKDGEIFSLFHFLGTNTVNGTSGADSLYGTSGIDHLFGFGGDDIIHPGAGADLIDGGTQGWADYVSYENSTSRVEFSLLAGGTVGDAQGDQYYSIEAARGSSFNDLIEGNDARNWLYGSQGDDIIHGFGDYDTVDGGLGSDTIYGDAGDDWLYDGNDNSVDYMFGGSGRDYIVVGAGDIAHGDEDDDHFSLKKNSSVVYGDAGNDSFSINANLSDLTVHGGDGSDTIGMGYYYSISISSISGVEMISSPTHSTQTQISSIRSSNNILDLSGVVLDGSLDIKAGTDSDTLIIAPGRFEGYNSNPDALRMFGAAGNDTLKGSSFLESIFGNAGDDIIEGGGGNDTIAGGIGSDTLILAGLQESYTISTVNGSIQVVDNQPTVDGNDGTDTISGIEILKFKDGATVGITSPVILDLDGNGVTTLSASASNARYDMNGDGLADDTSWFGSGEGMLFLDRDGNGKVTNAGEFSFIDDVQGAKSDLEGLRAFDSNKDGILSSLDAKFADFRIWRDRDGDGVAEDGEILSLTTASVRSVNLAGTAVEGTSALGDVAVINKGSYTRTNGTTMEFIDAALTYFSSATNLPSIAVQSESYGGKAKQYRIKVAGGEMTVTANKSKNQVDPRAGILGASNMLGFKNQTIGMLSPIILDLDGDGVEMRSIKKAKASFDMNGDGVADDTGWVGKGDGFLVIDRNNDGKIAHASELSFASEDKDARSDLEALAALDNNNDRKLDKNDARFGELKVWVDANGNGVTDSGELKTLADLGITEIGLVGRDIDSIAKVGDNVLISTATFTRANGSVGTLGNAALAYRPSQGSAAINGVARNNEGRFVMPDHGLPENADVDTGNIIDPEVNAFASDSSSAMEQAAAILRGGRSGGGFLVPPIDMFDNGRLTVNIFDYYEQPDLQAAGAAIGNEPTSLRLADATDASAVTQDLPASLRAVDAVDALPVDKGSLDPSSTRLLALMAQDMAAFGARSGENDLSWRRDGVRPVEYFA